MPKITPFLWFDRKAAEAARFYVSIFGGRSKITAITRFSAAGPGPKGSVMTVAFRLGRQEFVGLNGGPNHRFNEAVSFLINCRTQKEIDYYWRKLSQGGRAVQCGWLEDRYGLFWQITPTVLLRHIRSKDPAKVRRVMEAMFGMVKLDIRGIEEAAKPPPRRRP